MVKPPTGRIPPKLPAEVAIDEHDDLALTFEGTPQPRISQEPSTPPPSRRGKRSTLLSPQPVETDPHSLSALFTYATPADKACIAVGCACKAGYGAVAVAMLLVFGDIFNPSSNLFDSGVVAFWHMSFFGIAAFALEMTDTWLVEKAKHRQVAEWKKAYVKSILRQDVGWYDVNNPEELSSRMGEAIVKIGKGLSVATSNLFMCFGQFVAGCVLGLSESWDVAMVALLVAAITYTPASLMQMRAISLKSRVTSEAYGVAGGIATEVLGALRTVSSFGLEAKSLERYGEALGVAETAGLGAVLKITFFGATSNSAMYYVLGVAILYSAFMLAKSYDDTYFTWAPDDYNFCALQCDPWHPFQIIHNYSDFSNCSSRRGLPVAPFQMSCKVSDDLRFFHSANGNLLLNILTSIPPLFFATEAERQAYFDAQFEENGKAQHCAYALAKVYIAFNAIFFGIFGFSQIGLPLNNLVEARVAVAEVLQTIHRKPPIDAFDKAGEPLSRARGKIDVIGVTFAYPAARDNLVCRGYSLSIPAGTSCALVGPSGSGKSTIISLLERFYDPDSGKVMLDGIDLRLLNVKALRAQLGLVGQEPVLFMGTIKENISLGADGKATEEEIYEAAKMANAHDFILKALNDGYETQVGYGGGKLSGGQKQRIAIARAIIKKPSVLLLDEATSALDNASEKIVQAALDAIMKVSPHTTVTIAHRLTTIKGCNKIAVVKEGRIVEQGSWDQLMAIGSHGVFHQLAFKQQQEMSADSDVMSHVSEERAEVQRLYRARRTTMAEGSDTMRMRRSTQVQHPCRRTSMRSTSISRAAGLTSAFSALPSASYLADKRMPPPSSPRQRNTSVATRLRPVSMVSSIVGDEPTVEAPKALPSNATKRLLALTPGDKPLYILGGVCAVITGVVKGLFGLFMIKSISTMQTNNPDEIRKHAVPWALMFLLIGVLNNVVEFIGQNALGRAGEHLTKNLRYKLMSILLRQEIGYFDEENNSVGELSEFLGEKVTFVQGIMGEKIGSIAQIQAMLVTCIIVMFTTGDWRVALVVLGFFPIMTVAMALALAAMMGDTASPADGSANGERTAGSVIGEVVTGIRTVASFNAEVRFFNDFSLKADSARDLAIGSTFMGGITTGLAFGLIYVIMGVQLLYGLWLASVGAFGGHDPLAIVDGCRDPVPNYIDGVLIPMVSLQMVMMQMSLVMNLATDASAANSAAVELFERLDRKSKRDPLSEDGEVLPEVRGHLECKDVHFAYPTRPAFLICKGYNLKIAAGQVCAFAGPSGSGKSTMIALLQRFYDPVAGQVLLDGYNITSLNLAWLRQQLGLVGQEPVLFNGTVAENIANGKVGGATQEEVEWAARAANAHDFITGGLAHGYDTQVGLRGSMLSGGQKQRVAIARALVRKPAVMLLDEATSALDNESEHVVQAALDDLTTKHKRTTIMIAHRLSTIRKADKIAVVSNGVVKEEGTHEELLKLGASGIYYGLVKASQD